MASVLKKMNLQAEHAPVVVLNAPEGFEPELQTLTTAGVVVMRAAGWDSVRVVAIDTDWSALRFRKNECIQLR